MALYYSPELVEKLNNELAQVNTKYIRVLKKLLGFDFKNKTAQEYVQHGFLRRLVTIKGCLENIFLLYPPPDKKGQLSTDDHTNLIINLQAFIFNLYGCLDNLAWIWVYETNFQYKNKYEVSLTRLKKHFSQGFSNYLDEIDAWLQNYLIDYRDALAHRIPLSVPTIYSEEESARLEQIDRELRELQGINDVQKFIELNAEKLALGVTAPWMVHSQNEGQIMYLHPQLLCDWETLVVLAEKFVEELEKFRNIQEDK